MANKDFINDYDLINAKRADINAENAPLWTLQYYFLTKDKSWIDKIVKYVEKCKTERAGLYNQLPFKTLHDHDKYMSPDQLIAFVGALKEAGMDKEVKEIWKYLWRHAFTYDNTQPGEINKDRTMQFGAVMFCGVSAGHKWLKPLLAIACIYSCATKKGETSGKLKAWTMFKSANMKITEFICTCFIKKGPFKSWWGIKNEYFPEDGQHNGTIARFNLKN